MDYLEA